MSCQIKGATSHGGATHTKGKSGQFPKQSKEISVVFHFYSEAVKACQLWAHHGEAVSGNGMVPELGQLFSRGSVDVVYVVCKVPPVSKLAANSAAEAHGTCCR